ncbi:low temperature requirement protein A [Myxococcaceae bacterium JPH2]|nr:low temperature requirement protein A [Myxococcaceae bacterium JPH2]
MALWGSGSLLRVRDGHEARVSYAELFFDLVYVFAVTQLSHQLLEHLTVLGAFQTLVLWFAVWLAWQYTCWVTNWFNPEAMPIRLLLLGMMLASLVMSAAIPEAFGSRGWVFAGCFAAMEVGRTLFIVLQLGPRHALAPNFHRMLAWLSAASALWILGGLREGAERLAFWVAAVATQYIAPMVGFWTPGLGRSRTSEWTIEGGHLAERCQLFVIVALGESILETGVTLSAREHWDTPILLATIVAFLGSVAMWWVYFDTSSKDGSEAIIHSKDPGRIGAYFHYVHVTIVAGVIVSAVGNERAIGHPDARTDTVSAAVLIAGPAIYLLGNAVYKRVVYGRFPASHFMGLGALAVLTPLSFLTNLLTVNGWTSLVMVAVAVWDGCARRRVAH